MATSRSLLSLPARDAPPLRKQTDKPKRARLRILIAGDPSRPMRAITLPHTLPLVASILGGALLLATVLLACGSWKLSDARAALERRLSAMVQAADSIALDSAGADFDGTRDSGSRVRGGSTVARPPSGAKGRFIVQAMNNGEEMEVTLDLASGELDADAYR
ncbi:MAG: hypothetical protein H7X95_09035, partial [Deltaproteobacteria bacterium]|nr:hypothetical protein [Deltaproteobacteria bacterium]